MADKDEKAEAQEPNSVDLLNRQYREDAEKEAAKRGNKPEPNAVDEINREAQGGKPTAAAQTEQQEESLNPPGGLEEESK
jgi:hypothetical protein